MECLFPNLSAHATYGRGCRCMRCTAANRAAQRQYRARSPEKYRMISRRYNRRRKEAVLTAYGGLTCRCCGETEICFLTLDHVFNDGWKDRPDPTKRHAGSQIYEKLRREGFPDKDRYQVLCMNCNFGKKINGGICPHKTAEVVAC